MGFFYKLIILYSLVNSVSVDAREYRFDQSALSDMKGVDVSVFNDVQGQAGKYDVEIYVNNKFKEAREIDIYTIETNSKKHPPRA